MVSLVVCLNEFCQSLGLWDNKHPVIEKLRTLNPSEQIAFVYDLMAEKNNFPKVREFPQKYPEDTPLIMKEAMSAFLKKDDIGAVRFYTLALTTASPGSPELAKAYANRSASLFRLRRYNASLMDIDRALSGSVEDTSKISLLERKKKCLRELKVECDWQVTIEKLPSGLSLEEGAGSSTSEAKHEEPTTSQVQLPDVLETSYHKKFPLPYVEFDNDSIPSASKKVKIDFNEEFGHHLVATQDITPGEILIEEKPFASSLSPRCRILHCGNCFVRCEALVPCPNCSWVMFCSEHCYEEALNRFHRVECRIMDSVISLELVNDSWLCFRMLLIVTRQGENLQMLMDHPVYKHPMERTFGPITEPFRSDDYDAVLQLEDHYNKTDPINIFRKCYEICVLLHFLKSTTFYGEEMEKFQSEPLKLSEKELFVGVLLMRYWFIIMTNSHMIRDVVEKPKQEPNDKRSHRLFVVGAGLYPLFSLLNHSCDSNTLRMFYRDSIACYAAYPIKKGEQIFTDYEWHHQNDTIDERRRQLRINYLFDCKCPPCTNGWPRRDDIREPIVKRISNSITQKELNQYVSKFRKLTDSKSQPVNRKQAIDFLREFISVFHKCVKRPCIDFFKAVGVLAFIVSETANHYSIATDSVLCLIASMDKSITDEYVLLCLNHYVQQMTENDLS